MVGSPLLELPVSGRIDLQAVDPERNVARWYSLELINDLFGFVVIETRWGRIGAHGKVKRILSGSEQEARSISRLILRRRATASRRIGVPYRVVQ